MSWSSGTNTIQEVDTNKSMTLQMIKLKKQGGGTELFVRKNDVKLGTKSVTQNGTYTAAADGKSGFSQFSVNVRGGNGSADSHGKPTGGSIKPGGAGSAVTGTDPETGEEVVVGVDEDGNIVQTPIPYGIKIVTPPTKTDYVYQEDMDYTGIGVKLTNKNGDTYTDVDHPSGWYVNPADLIFPVEKAPAASGPADFTAEKGTWITSAGTVLGTFNGRTFTKINDGAALAFFASPDIDPYHDYYCISTDNESAKVLCDGALLEYHPLEYMGVTFHIYAGYGFTSSQGASPNVQTVDFSGCSSLGDMLQCLGVVPGARSTATIPVKWLNPYTGETRQDTFEITSTPASGDAHTSTGSSGTEGSGGGGTF